MTRYMMFASLLLAASHAQAEPPAHAYFAFDSASLSETQTPNLIPFIASLMESPDTRLVLEAHADPVGNDPYNIALSARRAEAVRDALIASGAPPERIVIAIYGEDGRPANSHAQDRRVTIVETQKPLHAIVDDLEAGPATAVLLPEPVTLAELEGPETEVVGRR